MQIGSDNDGDVGPDGPFEAASSGLRLFDPEVFAVGEHVPPPPSIDPATWTGTLSRKQRLEALGVLLPVAMNAVEQLIHELEKPGSNGGPPLDHKSEALSNLRELHRTLGSILSAIDEGTLVDDFGQGLPAEAARFAVRVANGLKDDPMPYATSAMILSVFTLLGFGGAGAWISSAVVGFTKRR